jgi:signal transduction histidine kinase/CheY-like chemotaxis protein
MPPNLIVCRKKQIPKMIENSLNATLKRLLRLKCVIIAGLILITMFPALMFYTRQSVELGAILQDEALILGRALSWAYVDESSVEDLHAIREIVDIVLGGSSIKAAHLTLDNQLLTDDTEGMPGPLVHRRFSTILPDGSELNVELVGSLSERWPLMITIVLLALAICMSGVFLVTRFVFRPWLRAEHEQELTRKRMADVVSLTSDWFWEQSAERRFSFVTDGLVKDLSFSMLHGKTWQEIGAFNLMDNQSADVGYEQILQAGFLVKLVLSATYYFHIKGMPILEPDGSLAGYRGAATDVTLQILQEKKLEDYRNHLTRVVDKRTHELLIAKQTADRANRAKSEFLANLSHEIRTPMNAILGLIHLLKSTSLERRQKSYLENLESSGNHLMGLLNDVLDLSKIESGKLQLEAVQFRVDELVKDVVQLMADRATSKSLSLDVQLENELPSIIVSDQQRLAQILLNFISNAIKFTDHGGVKVIVSVVEKRSDSTVLLFEVVDTGVGMDRATQGRVFEDFTQADSSTSRKYGGTGLGLAIAKKLTDLLGGRIGVESEPGEGSTFWISLPVKVIESHDAPDKENKPSQLDYLPESRSFQTPTVLKQKRILVVEDNPVNQSVLARILTTAGAVVSSADNGKQALSFCEENHDIDLILMDLWMPEMNGFEATARIKQLDAYSQIPILCISARLDPEIQQSCLEAGFSSVLSKPVKAEQLLSVVESSISVRDNAADGLDCEGDLLMPLVLFLKEGDVAAIEYINEYEKAFRSCMGKDFHGFVRLLEDFEFEGALELIMSIKNKKEASFDEQ